jgi:hypothetical protein|eukprot:COSAG01_NODE_661_length_14426_cov_32.272632_3_plen_187_part_00
MVTRPAVGVLGCRRIPMPPPRLTALPTRPSSSRFHGHSSATQPRWMVPPEGTPAYAGAADRMYTTSMAATDSRLPSHEDGMLARWRRSGARTRYGSMCCARSSSAVRRRRRDARSSADGSNSSFVAAGGYACHGWVGCRLKEHVTRARASAERRMVKSARDKYQPQRIAAKLPYLERLFQHKTSAH